MFNFYNRRLLNLNRKFDDFCRWKVVIFFKIIWVGSWIIWGGNFKEREIWVVRGKVYVMGRYCFEDCIYIILFNKFKNKRGKINYK